jgi:hypothetical protein
MVSGGIYICGGEEIEQSSLEANLKLDANNLQVSLCHYYVNYPNAV